MSTLFQGVYVVLLLLSPLPLWAWVLRRLVPGAPWYARLLTLLTGWLLTQALFSMGLAAVSGLNFGVILTGQGLLLAVGLALLWKEHRRSPFNFTLPRLNLPEMVVVVLLVTAGLMFAYQNLRTPITNFDSLAYHLTASASAFQTGQLVRPAELAQVGAYPYTFELIAALFLFPTGSDIFVTLPSLLAWVLFGLSIYGLARSLGAVRLPALAASGLLLMMPLVQDNINTLHVDLVFAAVALAGMCFATLAVRSPHALWSNLVIVCVGLLLGFKLSGLGYAAVIGVYWLILSAVERKPWPGSGWVRGLLPGMLAAALVGAVWFVLNLVAYGNPLGYMRIAIGPLVLWPGNTNLNDYLRIIYPAYPELTGFMRTHFTGIPDFSTLVGHSSLAFLFRVEQWADWQILLRQILEQGGWGFALTGLLGLVGLLRSAQARIGQRLLLGAVLLSCAVLHWLMPFSADNVALSIQQITPWIGQAFRYALAGFGLVGVLAGLVGKRLSWLLVMALAAVVLIRFAGWPLVAAGLIAALLMAAVWLPSLKIPLRLGMAAVGLVLALWAVVPVPQARADWQAGLFKGVGPAVAQFSAPGERIAFLTTFYNYPLFGPRLQRTPVFFPARTDSMAPWVQALRAADIHLVAVGPFRDENWLLTKEYRWMSDPTGPFERVFGADGRTDFVIFRIK